MPSKKTTIIREEKERPEDGELEDFISSLGPSVTDVHVYRYRAGKAEWLDSWPLTACTMEALREKYGFGSFVIRVRNAGKYVKGGNKMIHIADPNPAAPAAVTVHQDNGGDAYTKMLELQSLRNHELTLAMINNMGKSAGPAFDPMTAVNAMITGVTALKAATEPASSSRTQELKDLLEIAEMIKGGGGSEDASPMGLLKSVLPALMMRGGSIPRALPQPGVDDIPPATPAADENQPRIPAGSPAVISPREFLLKAASQRDPGIYADFILEKADYERIPEAIAIVASVGRAEDVDTWLNAQEWIPAEHREWFGNFYTAMREVLINEGLVHSPGSSGHAADAAPNGAAGSTRVS